MPPKTRLILALVFVAVLGWFAVDLFEFAMPPQEAADEPTEAERHRRASLEGAPQPAPYEPTDDIADETDLRTLVTSLTQRKDHPAAKRLAELAAKDPTYIQDLIGWLRLEQDGERETPLDHPLAAPKAGMTLLNVRRALVAIGRPALDALLLALNDDDQEMRIRVAHSIGFFGASGAPAVSELLTRCRVNDLGKYECAALVQGLGGIGPAASGALPQLHEMVRTGETNEVIENAVIDALLRIAESEPETLETVRQLFEGESYTGKLHVLQTLTMEKGLGEALIPLIVALVRRDEDERLSTQGVYALASMGVAHPEAVALLLEIFHGEDQYNWGYRDLAANALARIGEAGRAALLASLDGKTPAARVHAAATLLNYEADAESVLTALVPAFESEDPKVLRRGFMVLSGVEPSLAIAWPLLKRGFAHGDQAVRAEALSVIGSVEGMSPQLLDALLELQSDPSPTVQSLSLHWLLQRVEHPNERVTAATLAAIRSVHWQTRNTGYRGLRAVLGAEAADDMEIWRRGLRDDKGRVFYTVLYEIGEMGPAAKEMLPELEKMLRGEYAMSNAADLLKTAIEKIKAE